MITISVDFFDLDRAKLLADVGGVVEGFRRNETEMPGVSNTVVDLLDRGWHYATLFFGETQIRTGHVLVAAMKTLELHRALTNLSKEFAKISPTMTLSAMSLGASPRRILARVHLPLVRPGVAVAVVLVMIDAVKELPIVLLLRPFGFTTVSVWVYELASENFWRQAALPALVIVAVATVPVFFLFRQVRLVDPHRKVG